MTPLVKIELIEEVRRRIDEITLSGERVLTDTDMEDAASSNFSDEDIGDRLNDSARYVAARVRSQFLPMLVETVSPVNFPNYQVLRVLGSRVRVKSTEFGEQFATRRTFRGHRKMEATGVPADAENPVYIYEDFELKVFPDPVSSSDIVAEVDIVRVPGSPHGQSLEIVNEPVEELDSRLREAVIQRTLVSCFASLRRFEEANKAQEELIRTLSPMLLLFLRTDAGE